MGKYCHQYFFQSKIIEMAQVFKKNKNIFLDLPEEIIWFILSHFEDAELYFNVRCICRVLKDIVEEYIKIGK